MGRLVVEFLLLLKMPLLAHLRTPSHEHPFRP